MTSPMKHIEGRAAYNQFIEAKDLALSAMSPAEYNTYCDGTSDYFIYRYWCDIFPEGKRLLYIGFTRDFGARDSIHQINSWWHRAVTRFDMDVYHCTRAEARAHEARTIKAEVPLFNIHKNPRHAQVHGPKWTSSAIEKSYYEELARVVAQEKQERLLQGVRSA